MSLLLAVAACWVTDGDTIRCGEERVRLLGIDAPEFHCPRTRDCVNGDPQAATDYLASLMRGREISLWRVGIDRYGRTLAIAYADDINLNCAMIDAGHAQYIARWDDGGRVAAECGW